MLTGAPCGLAAVRCICEEILGNYGVTHVEGGKLPFAVQHGCSRKVAKQSLVRPAVRYPLISHEGGVPTDSSAAWRP